jgi:hypothetical protein
MCKWNRTDCRSFLRVFKVTEKIKTRSKPTPSENFNSHPLYWVYRQPTPANNNISGFSSTFHRFSRGR